MSLFACYFAFLALALRLSNANQWNHDEDGVDKYITRPDIVSPRWQVKIHDEHGIAPGYWFVAPYEKIGERKSGGAWIGPHIYDGKGGLIWSGSYMWDDRNIMDFTLSNVRGEKRLTMMLPPEEDGLILDNHYRITEKVPVGIKGETLNMHEFRFADDGDSLLLLTRNITFSTKEQAKAIGYEGECHISFDGFKEVDTTSWETRFEWSSSDHITLDESTMTSSPAKDRCEGPHWDYLHSNALDKFPDGHYLFSARHADTVYKIDKDDGHIHWRLGGKSSDFDMGDLVFSRQHHTRVRSQNETHTTISLFDNCKGQDSQKATCDWSRALLISLQTDITPMTAELTQAYDHPYKEIAYRRGDYQILDNGNAFICWSEHSLQSEHSPDGKILWEARMEPTWIGTYRATKYEFVGEPLDPPDVHSKAFSQSDPNNSTYTTVHVSWNGATEVQNWNLYKTDEEGRTKIRVSSTPRSGFETRIIFSGYASFVILEAIDKHGVSLGQSSIIRTIPSDNMATPAVEEEIRWLDEVQSTSYMIAHEAKHAVSNPIATFFAGVIASAVVVFVVTRFRKRRASSWWRVSGLKSGRYARVDGVGDYDETKLDDMSSSSEGRGQKSPDQFQLTDDEEEEERGLNAKGRLPYVRQVSSTA